jgi:uncharacterized phage-associated protein
MHDLNTSDIENISKKLMNEFRGVLSWEWDNRFKTVLATISTDKKDSVREVLERCLINVWDSANIDKASDTIQTVIDQLGGLMSGQLLFTSDPEKDAFIFCAWWPWGDGKTISVRIAPVFKIQSDSEMAERAQIFKSWFGM